MQVNRKCLGYQRYFSIFFSSINPILFQQNILCCDSCACIKVSDCPMILIIGVPMHRSISNTVL